MGEEVFPWLKSLPLAPEYHPTLAEFQDPISYIFKIEKDASNYGICKIIPPVSTSPKKTITANLNQSLSSQSPDSSPTFTTRQQQIGFCPRNHERPVQKSVWESGEYYTLPQFESKAKTFEKSYKKKRSNPTTALTALEVETLYWKAQMGKPFSIEYANDMPGTAFDQTVGENGGGKQGTKEINDVMTVEGSQWNMNVASRAKGSLLTFMKDELPGVNSPMVYISMLFSWFAWHVEDHDFHSLNYMHMGASKTWYGVPKDAAVAFEDVVREHGYGGEINPLVTFATLAQKTTIMSPEVLLKAGVPCCRLVQNAGEFVVTFPRAYHSGFSHGFNCAEATNIATPGWLFVAREASIRRVSMRYAPMVSHSQLLYDLALSLFASEPIPEPRSSRLKDKLRGEGDALVKRLFLQDMMQNNELLHVLGKGFPIVVLSEDDLVSWIPSDLSYKTQSSSSTTSSVGLCTENDEGSSFGRCDSPTQKDMVIEENEIEIRKPDPASVFSCITCGIMCYSCVAIVQPSMAAARYFMSGNDLVNATDYANVVDLGSSSDGEMLKNGGNGLLDVPVKSEDDSSGTTSVIRPQENDSALKLLALAYGNTSDFEEEDDFDHSKSNCSMGPSENQIEVTHPDIKPSSLINLPYDEDSSRRHVFCLQHAREVEQRLRSVGGVHMLLVCHPDYPKIDEEARLMAEEFGIDQMWTDLGYREINEHDRAKIRSALDDDNFPHSNQSWVVKLGLDIIYSARLSLFPIYKKQMPYNSVIYNAIGHFSPSTEQTISKPSGKQKKIVAAGKWCGKVWMSNQVHPFLIGRDLEKHDETSFSVLSIVEVKSSPPPPPPQPPSPPQRTTRLRNNQIRKKPVPNLNKKPREPDSDSDDDYTPTKRITKRKKKAKPEVSESDSDEEIEGEFGCDIEGCDMSFKSKKHLMVHKRNVCNVKGCAKKLFSHRYLLQHRRVHKDTRPLKCPWVGCSRTFKWAWARTEHLRVHTGARPYQCTEEGCGKTFRFVSDFSRHKRQTGHLKKNQDLSRKRRKEYRHALLLLLAFFRSKNDRTVERMKEGSTMALVPSTPEASLVVTGGIRLIPNSSIVSQCFSVNEFFHVNVFIDGATKIGFS
ncbi:hypothetical protein LXL04_031920 [Taraxacum kok-saghyz]